MSTLPYSAAIPNQQSCIFGISELENGPITRPALSSLLIFSSNLDLFSFAVRRFKERIPNLASI